MLTFRNDLKNILINHKNMHDELNINNSSILEIEESLNSGELIISVVGEVNRGKSKFLNALLESSLFPSRATVCTAGVTILDNGSNPEAEIIYKNGKVEGDVLTYYDNGNLRRIEYIKNSIIKHFKIKTTINPLKKINILDIGCGGGLLSEPMCKLGAKVVGIDASKKNIEIAKFHAKKNDLKINYICSSPEVLKIDEKFDVILNMEIVEHVEDINFFIKKSSELLKKNGLMFIATLNKTLKSYVFAIVGAEYILQWLPIGTHDWDKFIKPEDLIKISKANNLKLEKLDGMKFNLLTEQWSLSPDNSVNYIAKFKKN